MESLFKYAPRTHKIENFLYFFLSFHQLVHENQIAADIT